MMPLIKKRLDYKPLKWLPQDTYLEILIFDDYTTVKSKIIFKKNICFQIYAITFTFFYLDDIFGYKFFFNSQRIK